jgi:hypothetical protein
MLRVVDHVEEYLPKSSAKLHRCIAKELQSAIKRIVDQQKLPLSKTFPDQVQRYEQELTDLVAVQSLLGHWGTPEQRPTLRLIPLQLSSFFAPPDGPNVGMLPIRYYPAVLTMYAGGVAAVAAERYDNLYELFQLELPWSGGEARSRALLKALIEETIRVRDQFQQIPGLERQQTAMSDRLALVLQPTLDEFLALGSRFDFFFDRFEVLLTLEYAHQEQRHRDSRIWGPPGRFARKCRRSEDPFAALVQKADAEGDHWAPLQAGFFSRSSKVFAQVAAEYGKFLQNIHW